MSVPNPLRKKTPKEMEREVKRKIGKEQRGVKKNITELKRDEKKLISEIKKAATQNDPALTKQLAAQLVRTRKFIAMASKSNAGLEGVKQTVKQAVMASAMADTIEKSTKVMKKINAVNNPQKILKNMQKYEREVAKQEFNEEMTTEALDAAFDMDGTMDDDAEKLADEVLAGLGIQLSSELESAPMKNVPIQSSKKEEDKDLDALMV